MPQLGNAMLEQVQCWDGHRMGTWCQDTSASPCHITAPKKPVTNTKEFSHHQMALLRRVKGMSCGNGDARGQGGL